MEQSAFPLNHLYIMMGTNVRGNEPNMNFKLKMLGAANKGNFRQNALMSDK
jgi:hypothetical protein